MWERRGLCQRRRQQDECQPDIPALNSYFWLLRTRTPGLQHKKENKGIELNGWKPFSEDIAKDPIYLICTLQ